MTTPFVNYPSFSAQFWWEGTLNYIDPREKNHQRFFLLYVSCVGSLGHAFERAYSYDWSAYVQLNAVSKALVSASNYWRVYDFASGLKGAVENYQKDKVQESLFKVMGSLSAAALMINELYNRKILRFESMNTVKFLGGILGGAVYFRKSVIQWVELGKPTENQRKIKFVAQRYLFSVEKLRDIMDLMAYITIFAIKMIGLIVLLSSDPSLSGIRWVVNNQSQCLLGGFVFATGCSLVSHFSDEYLDRYVELNKRFPS